MRVVLIFILVLLCKVALGADYSGTLPVFFITTNEGKAIDSKTDYVDATFYVETFGLDGYVAVGSVMQQQPVKIRGRGNWTWKSFDKKPYKIKLESGMPLLGMAKNKHFALLAHADYSNAFFRNTCGFELGRMLGLQFVPHQQPVELMLNGEYMGLYFLTETVRVGKNRVNITEQENGETNSYNITGGWLVEIDNYPDDHQVIISTRGTNLALFRITYSSPDSLSWMQRSYLREQMTELLRTVYLSDKNSQEWEQILDLPSLTRYYLACEIVDHIEAFLGSCYMFKDRGDEQWKFGPMWDLGHAFNSWHAKTRFIYDYDTWEPCIMAEIAKFPRFQQSVKELWNSFYPDSLQPVFPFMDQFALQINEAARCDYERWGGKYGTSDAIAMKDECIGKMREKVAWLDSMWGENSRVADCLSSDNAVSIEFYDLNGRKLDSTNGHNIYIKKVRNVDGKVKTSKIMNDNL